MKNCKGFTLIELMVAMVVFIFVLIVTASAFNTILKQTSKLFRSEESTIEGMVGLEMFRHDLQQAGLGLFTELAPLAFEEAASTPASSFNDINHVPRPIVTANGDPAVAGAALSDVTAASSVLAGTDYLAVKATTVARNQTSQKWSYLEVVGGVATPKVWPSNAENYKAGEYFVLLRKAFSLPPRTSIERNTTDSSLWFRLNSPAFDTYTSQAGAVFITYGIDDNNFRFPFNRADYFVARTDNGANMPPVCAPNTGVLYKTTINQSNGKSKYIPLVDCVADMQLVLGWDIDLDGAVDTWSNADGTSVNGKGNISSVQNALSQMNNDSNDQTTLNIRNCLKMVKVYLIVQDGKKDTGYTSPATIPMGEPGEKNLIRNTGAALTAEYSLSSDMRNYRWKEYRIVVRPKNLLSNQ